MRRQDVLIENAVLLSEMLGAGQGTIRFRLHGEAGAPGRWLLRPVVQRTRPPAASRRDQAHAWLHDEKHNVTVPVLKWLQDDLSDGEGGGGMEASDRVVLWGAVAVGLVYPTWNKACSGAAASRAPETTQRSAGSPTPKK